MGNSVYALLTAAAAGFTMLIGAAAVLITRNKNEKLLAGALGLASGVMISAALLDMLPHASEHFEASVGHIQSAALSAVFLLLGIVISLALDKLVPGHHSDEHDHDHIGNEDDEKKENLLHVGLISALALGLHNLPEGMAIYVSSMESAAVGISIAAAVAFHNVPAGIIIAMPVYYATGSKKKALGYTFLSGIAEPLGALLALLLLRDTVNDMLLGAVFALVSGIMLYIAFEELIPSSRQYGRDKTAFWCTISGVCLMIFAHAFE